MLQIVEYFFLRQGVKGIRVCGQPLERSFHNEICSYSSGFNGTRNTVILKRELRLSSTAIIVAYFYTNTKSLMSVIQKLF